METCEGELGEGELVSSPAFLPRIFVSVTTSLHLSFPTWQRSKGLLFQVSPMVALGLGFSIWTMDRMGLEALCGIWAAPQQTPCLLRWAHDGGHFSF